MEEQKFSFSGSYQKSKEYLETQFEIFKLKMISRASKIVGAIVLDLAKLMMTLIIVFFLALALGFYLGELMGHYSLGFLVTGVIFIVLLFILRAFEPKLEVLFMNLTIKKMLSKLNDADDEDEQDEQREKEQDAVNQNPPKAGNPGNPTVKEMFEKEIDHEGKNY